MFTYRADNSGFKYCLVVIPLRTADHRRVATLQPFRPVPLRQFFDAVRLPVDVKHFARAVTADVICDVIGRHRTRNGDISLALWRQFGQGVDPTPVFHFTTDEDHVEEFHAEHVQ